MVEDRGRKTAVAALFVLALLGLASLASVVVVDAVRDGEDGSELEATGSLASGASAGRSRGAELPGADEPTTFEAADRAPEEASEEEAGEEGEEEYERPQRRGQAPERRPEDPPEGGMPEPAPDRTGTGGGGAPPSDEEEETDGGAPPSVYEPTIVAVIDSCFDPYHYDFLSSKMPQHLDSTTSNDLPLTTDPSTWIPGFPSSGSDTYVTYTALDLTMPGSPTASPTALHTTDAARWASVAPSSLGNVKLYWIPGTKVVGYANFGDSTCSDGFSATSHGVGSSSVSVGNIHGSCPECLFVFVNGMNEASNRWVEKQTWIDAQTNSWGASTVGGACVGVCVTLRDRIYAGSDVNAQKTAVERGQAIFFSAGNGIQNDFSVPNPTLMSSQEGPDWIITVGGVFQDGDVISGTGKPADIASVGDGYPSAGGATVSSDSTFGGTSNATPVTAGLYARALHQLRTEMTGMSRIQTGGKIAQGTLACGSANPSCATADGVVTIDELREALFHAPTAASTFRAVTPLGPSAGFGGTALNEAYLAGAGHGYYLGMIGGIANLNAETKAIKDFAAGGWFATMDPDKREWMIHDSFCRQEIWGDWTHGYWDRLTDPVPLPDPTWPMRTSLYGDCYDTWDTVVFLVE